MGKAAVRAVRAAKYVGAGTIEFLVDKEGNFYFIEANTRIQVEHPVTEMVTGIDVVKEQIRIAAGEKLSYSQRDISTVGHAIEFRINAEDPDNHFKPMAGQVELYSPPGGPGIRVDSHIYSGYTVPPFYDSLLAKLVTWGRTRDEAISKARRALKEFVITGLKTTIPFHQRVVENAAFVQGEVFTDFVERHMGT
jgi:acetyl-CoA carboxylase biotin carboxylase subunit